MAAGGRQLRLARAKTARGGTVRLQSATAGSEKGGWVYTEPDRSPKGKFRTAMFQSTPAHNGGRSRRDFLSLAGTIAVGTTCGQSLVKTVEPEAPPNGILLPITLTTHRK